MLEKEEVPLRVAGMFYQAVVASVLLYGGETWVLPPSVYKVLEGFHVEAVRRLTGMRPQEVKGEWVYPHSANVLAAAHLQPIEYYIQRRLHTISQTIEGREILEECRGAERRQGTLPRLYWWRQNMEDSAQRVYGREGGEMRGAPHPSPPAAARPQLALQAQPTINLGTDEEEAELDCLWRQAHINN